MVDLGLERLRGAGPADRAAARLRPDGAVEAQGVHSTSSCIPNRERHLRDAASRGRLRGAGGRLPAGRLGPVGDGGERAGARSASTPTARTAATGTRGGDATIEPLEPAERELSRFVLDRSTDWVTGGAEQSDYITTAPRVGHRAVREQRPADSVTYELVMPSTEEAWSGPARFRATAPVRSPTVVGGGEEVVDIRLVNVPDGVARFWAALAPSGRRRERRGRVLGERPRHGLRPGRVRRARARAPPRRPSWRRPLPATPTGWSQLATQTRHGAHVRTETPEQVFALPENDALHVRALVRCWPAPAASSTAGTPANETIAGRGSSTEEFARLGRGVGRRSWKRACSPRQRPMPSGPTRRSATRGWGSASTSPAPGGTTPPRDDLKTIRSDASQRFLCPARISV